jgi:hypothetical protein
MTLIPDHHRIRTLNALKDRKADLILQLNSLPIRIELPSVKKHKLDIETQLNEVEHGIELFSRLKVFVPTPEYLKTGTFGMF